MLSSTDFENHSMYVSFMYMYACMHVYECVCVLSTICIIINVSFKHNLHNN